MKKIGILGIGLVGRSFIEFLKNREVEVLIWDESVMSNDLGIYEFLCSNDINLISPGISYKKYFDFYKKNKNKVIGELDLFFDHFKQPIISVTGSLGKTTVCRIICYLVERDGLSCGLAGNIGNPMLNLVGQENFDMAILELSSFQLFLNKKFAPDIAIWTNFYPNHLDWHDSEEHYFDSKFKIFEFQSERQYSIFPIDLLNEKNISKFIKLKSHICIVSTSSFDSKKHLLPIKKYYFFCLQDNILKLLKIANGIILEVKEIFDISILPDFSFLQNWIYSIISIYLYGLSLNNVALEIERFNLSYLNSEHRLEKFLTVSDIDFYNDSKSTIPQATEFALKKLSGNGRPIILILGGLSKGVSRIGFIDSLKDRFKNIKEILFFGDEAYSFLNLKTYSCLEKAVVDLKNIAKLGDQVLFSPSGSSFDLFRNYIDRGNRFKKLVLKEYVNDKPAKQIEK